MSNSQLSFRQLFAKYGEDQLDIEEKIFDGAAADREWGETTLKFMLHQQNALRIFMDRHRKYGPKNIAVSGHDGVIVRIEDKLARLRNNEADLGDESIADTHYDLSNYSLIGLMVASFEWPEADITEMIAGVQATISKLNETLDMYERIKRERGAEVIEA